MSTVRYSPRSGDRSWASRRRAGERDGPAVGRLALDLRGRRRQRCAGGGGVAVPPDARLGPARRGDPRRLAGRAHLRHPQRLPLHERPPAGDALPGGGGARGPHARRGGRAVGRGAGRGGGDQGRLRAAGYVGPYLFPDNNRRRIPGYLYLATAAACVALWALLDDSPYVNGGFLFAAVLLALVGAYQLVTAWSLDVDEQDALVAASRTVGFPVGHASAQMGWRGLLSRPTWRILLYSDENPPAKRGLVLVDGHDGEVIEHFVEDNPEDWSQLDRR